MIGLIASVSLACNAVALFAQVAAATGGSAWNRVGEITASGALFSSGLRGTAQLSDEIRDGRYARLSALPVKGSTAEVYDGQNLWVRDISGGVHPYDSWYPRARAVTEAFLTRRGYLDSRSGAAMTCVGFTGSDPDRAEVVRVAPRGGVPVVVTVDSRSHLISSVAIRTPITSDLTTFGDYRQVGGIVLPFSISRASLFEPANGDRVEVTRYAVSPRVRAADFVRPRTEDKARMLAGASATTVPIALEGDQLFVWASIDGRAPMPFILDSGGHAILDGAAARTLGLRATGGGVSGGAGAGTIALQYTRVASVRIGNAELLDQPFLVIQYPYSFYERGRKVPLAGILGLEWFERYATRIDYARKSLTLAPLTSFAYRGRGTPVPIRFQEDVPLAHAAADGSVGEFGVDTGNAGILILYGDFLRRTELLAKYGQGYTVHGAGTGGSNTGRLETLARFDIGGHEISKLLADFTQMRTGAFSSWTEAGDLGLSVLSHFTPTFDYANQTLYLEPLAHPLIIPRNRSGIGFTKNGPDAIDVVAIRPNSAASALGIVAGDQILTVNDTAARDLSAADFVAIVTGRAGRVLRLTVRHGTTTRKVELMLR
ncbi:MAG: aspartyl protease family protein [Candidatus Cybelea sp.]